MIILSQSGLMVEESMCIISDRFACTYSAEVPPRAPYAIAASGGYPPRGAGVACAHLAHAHVHLSN